MKKLLALFVLFALVAPALSAQDRWNLDVKCGKLKPISMKVGVNTWKTWWYVVFDIKNQTGADRTFNAIAKVTTETKKRSRTVFSPTVHKNIEQKEGAKLVNILMPGKSIDGKSMKAVLIISNLDKLADRITINVQGLASYIYKDGLKVYKEIREWRVVMNRVGDEFEVTRNRVTRRRPSWVVVKKVKIQG